MYVNITDALNPTMLPFAALQAATYQTIQKLPLFVLRCFRHLRPGHALGAPRQVVFPAVRLPVEQSDVCLVSKRHGVNGGFPARAGISEHLQRRADPADDGGTAGAGCR